MFDGVQLDAASPTPLYVQLRNRLRDLLEQGFMGAGEAMPGERDLAQSIGVSRVTVRRALNDLVSEGLLIQRQGAGTFIAERIEQPLSLLTGFSEDMRIRGLVPGVIWLEKNHVLPTTDEAMALNLSPGARVARLKRVRTADGRALAIELATLSAELVPDLEGIGKSLYAALEARGVKPVRALQRLRAELVTAQDAQLLSVPEGSAVLAIERRSFLADGRPVEYTRSRYRADLYDFVAELRTDAAPNRK